MYYRSSYTPGGPSYTFQGTRRELDKHLAKTGTKVVGGMALKIVIAKEKPIITTTTTTTTTTMTTTTTVPTTTTTTKVQLSEE